MLEINCKDTKRFWITKILQNFVYKQLNTKDIQKICTFDADSWILWNIADSKGM